MTKTVLVTGAHGFLGRYVSLRFKQGGYRVLGLGIGDWGAESPAAFGIDEWIASEVSEASLDSLGVEIEGIVHCAGSGSVAYSFENPAMDFSLNVSTALIALDFIRRRDPGMKFIYPSSAAVYGLQEDRRLREDDEPKPVSPYGYHKLIAEQLCRSYAANFGIRAGVIRYFSIYGEGLRKLLPWEACRRLSASGSSVEFFGTGSETRDWIHAADAADIACLLFQNLEGFTLVNGGSGRRCSVEEAVRILNDAMGTRKSVSFNGIFKPGDPRHYWADVSRAAGLGWANRISLETGLAGYAAWFREKA